MFTPARLLSPIVKRVSALSSMLLLLVGTLTACMGPKTALRLPTCTESVEVEGQHLRRGDTLLTFDHTFDLPGSTTEVSIEHADGNVVEHSFPNVYPDILHVLGGGLLFVGSGALLLVYAEEASRRTDPLTGNNFWALPVGLALLGMSSATFLTGWNPGGPITLPDECTAQPPKNTVLPPKM